MRMFESGCAGFAQTNRPANGEPVRFYAVSQEVNLTPTVERRRADAVLAAQLGDGRAGLGLLEHGDDLAVGEAGLLHGTSSEKGTRKFHFWRQLMGGGITIRARMLYDAKARKDGAVVETVLVDDEGPMTTNFEFQRMTMASVRKKQVKRVVEYGPYIPTLARLLEEGYFE